VVFWSCDDEEVGLFYFIEVDDILIEPDLNVSFFYLIAFLVFFDKLLKVGARIAQFLLADVENDLPYSAAYHLLSTHHLLFKFMFKYQSISKPTHSNTTPLH
jgi:hypothetical protein